MNNFRKLMESMNPLFENENCIILDHLPYGSGVELETFTSYDDNEEEEIINSGLYWSGNHSEDDTYAEITVMANDSSIVIDCDELNAQGIEKFAAELKNEHRRHGIPEQYIPAIIDHVREFYADQKAAVAESDATERPYVCVHVKKGTCEVTATSSYDAAKKAAINWGLKNAAGINCYLADVEHVATESAEDVGLDEDEQQAIADEIEEISVEIEELVQRALDLMPPSAAKDRARVYWYGHIMAAVGNEDYSSPYNTTMRNTY